MHIHTHTQTCVRVVAVSAARLDAPLLPEILQIQRDRQCMQMISWEATFENSTCRQLSCTHWLLPLHRHGLNSPPPPPWQILPPFHPGPVSTQRHVFQASLHPVSTVVWQRLFWGRIGPLSTNIYMPLQEAGLSSNVARQHLATCTDAPPRRCLVLPHQRCPFAARLSFRQALDQLASGSAGPCGPQDFFKQQHTSRAKRMETSADQPSAPPPSMFGAYVFPACSTRIDSLFCSLAWRTELVENYY